MAQVVQEILLGVENDHLRHSFEPVKTIKYSTKSLTFQSVSSFGVLSLIAIVLMPYHSDSSTYGVITCLSFIHIINHLTCVNWRCFKGDIITDTDLGERSKGINRQRVFPLPVSAMIIKSC